MTTAVIALAALAFSSTASAKNERVDGVRASLKHGTLKVQGGDQGNEITIRLKALDPSQIQVDAGDNGSADFSFSRADVTAIYVQGGNGNDSIRIDDVNGGLTNSIPTTIAGGPGNDSLKGGLGAEDFQGGEGSDSVIGGKGNDTAELGSGNDTFRWDPGDGSDVIHGQSGTDTMLFNGAGAAEKVTMAADEGQLVFVRDVAEIKMVTDGVEIVDFNALGGADEVTVNDLTGTDVTQTNLDLAGTLGGNTADAAADKVVVNGTNGDDTINVQGNGSGADVSGLASAVSVTHADPTFDVLSVNTLAGTDSVTTNAVVGVLKVLIDGVAV